MTEITPPTPADADLRDFAFTPFYRARLFGSMFHARANDAEWRAGVTLWLKSQDQVPAGSLPDDDTDLCRLAELGRDLKTWRKLRPMALHGWYLCSDGRLYHSVISEIVTEQWKAKKARCDRTEKARTARLLQRQNSSSNGSKGQGQGYTPHPHRRSSRTDGDALPPRPPSGMRDARSLAEYIAWMREKTGDPSLDVGDWRLSRFQYVPASFGEKVKA